METLSISLIVIGKAIERLVGGYAAEYGRIGVLKNRILPARTVSDALRLRTVRDVARVPKTSRHPSYRVLRARAPTRSQHARTRACMRRAYARKEEHCIRGAGSQRGTRISAHTLPLSLSDAAAPTAAGAARCGIYLTIAHWRAAPTRGSA